MYSLHGAGPLAMVAYKYCVLGNQSCTSPKPHQVLMYIVRRNIRRSEPQRTCIVYDCSASRDGVGVLAGSPGPAERVCKGEARPGWPRKRLRVAAGETESAREGAQTERGSEREGLGGRLGSAGCWLRYEHAVLPFEEDGGAEQRGVEQLLPET